MVAGHKGARVLLYPANPLLRFVGAALLLAALGASDAQAQRRGLGLPALPSLPSLPSVPSIGAAGSGIGSSLGITDGSGSGVVGSILTIGPNVPAIPDVSVGNAVVIEGLYERTIDTAKQAAGKSKDKVGKGLPGAGRQGGPSRVPPAGERRFVPTEVLVGLPSNLTPQALDALARRHRLVRLESLTSTTFHRWQITDQRSVADVVRALEADTSVRVAQPNYRF